ncbi:MAG: YwiC-like family protein [Chloroflexi bacterium]|nr:YwiC-like family protein [Chloroflexota bacterium]
MNLNLPVPKEHGSWAMLTVPLLLGLVIAPAWHWRALVLVVAALGFFLVRQPLAMLVKTRKRTSADRGYLWRWTAIYGGLTVLSSGWLVLAQGLWWLALMGFVGGISLLFNLWLVSRRQEMSLTGEVAGIAGLALGAPMTYYAASSQLDGTAAILWLINFLYFGGTVFYIKLKVRQQPRLPAPNRIGARLVAAKACLAYQTIALTVLILLVTLRQAPLLIPLALIPATIKTLYGAWRWQDKKSLSLVRLGVIEILHTIAFAALVVLAFS